MHALRTFLRAAVAGLALAAGGHAAAQTTNGNFNVTVAFTSNCAVRGATPAVDFGTYTAFAAAPSTPNPTAVLSFRCTRGLAGPVISIDATSGTVAGLAYTLALGPTSVLAGQTGDAGVTGTYDVYNATVTGSMAGNQAGQVGAPATEQRQMTITF